MVPELAALKLGAGSSILTACELLRAQWPFTQHMPGMPPIFLLHQIYLSVREKKRARAHTHQRSRMRAKAREEKRVRSLTRAAAAV